MVKQPYDDLSLDYDKFVNWENRLNYELPFLKAQIDLLGNDVRIFDSACGTGGHAIALAQQGYQVSGADLSNGMVEQARINAVLANLEICFAQAGFGELANVFGEGGFDLILCLGNSLPHVLELSELSRTLADFAKCLRPGGMVMIQNRNFNAVLERKERWMEPQSYQDQEREWLFLRFYEYLLDGTINFNIMTLRRDGNEKWQQSVTSTLLRPWLQDELYEALAGTGFEVIRSYGDMRGNDFNRLNSGNLVMTALKKGRRR